MKYYRWHIFFKH